MPFHSTFSYKLIYIFRINDKAHQDLLKIGDTSIDTETDALAPNSKPLNEAAKQRIKSYTHTAGIQFELLHTELAVRTVNKNGVLKTESFRDYQVHQVLRRSGIKNHYFDKENRRNEWFETDLNTAQNAINAVKENRLYLNPEERSKDDSPIIFRPEQEKAINDTLRQFKKGNRMLWNAKMRFGKTLSALQVVKLFPFNKVLICTHRPVVNEGWFEDFNKIFKNTSYQFGSKKVGSSIQSLIYHQVKKFVYFASIQDLRASAAVGGKFDKNDEVFLTDWDLIIVDEAHEGTQTSLGQKVLDTVLSNNPQKMPKLLELSGTPFNLISDFKQGEIFTWDYIMEQQAKTDWQINHFGDSNPYEDLPRMEIYTYDLDKNFPSYVDLEDSAFNFKEFFRTWTGDVQKDYQHMPSDAHIGDFVHKKDVNAFLNLLTDGNKNSNYPFSTEAYRSFFRHTLWMLPGVKEAKALSKLLREHPIFGNSQFFKIVNVAGAGDEEQEYTEALANVRAAIGENPDDHYSITLSCGRLTTGVTVPEWTGVFMLAGSFSTSAANYMQTIFRVQTPANINGRMKERCCVFDFAPDRTLKMVAEASQVSASAGKTTANDRVLMGQFLNFCPVIAVQGSKMAAYHVSTLLQQLKKAYTDRVVKNGFDDKHLYNENLLKLNALELEDFEKLKTIVKNAKQPRNAQNELTINDMGFTNEEYEKLNKIERKTKKELTPEEKEFLEEKKKKQENARKAMAILRAISIRIPLLVYGADVNAEQEINVKNFVDLIDDHSWSEFMPQGVTKEVFKKFSKYYEQDVFIAAGRQIRALAKSADSLAPTERVQKIAALFETFKNPDKETVLTPWRVVNMHLGTCLGGYNFYNEKFSSLLDEPQFIDHGKVTACTMANPQATVLEINSKTGLYPLYVAYSIYRAKLNHLPRQQHTLETQTQLWQDTVQNNIFILCQTPMAKSITQRTLLGYKSGKINAHYFEDLINQLKNKSEQVRNKILKGSFWDREETKMKFDAIVGNPPYQIEKGAGGNNDAPCFQYFVIQAQDLNPKYSSLIIPAKWFAAGRENLLGQFRQDMLNNKHLRKLITFTDAKFLFNNVEIKGGLCFYLMDFSYAGPCQYTLYQGNLIESVSRTLNDFDILIRFPILNQIIKDVFTRIKNNKKTVESIVSSDTPFNISSNPETSKKNPIKIYTETSSTHNTMCFYITKAKRQVGFIDATKITKNTKDINKYKVFIPGGYGAGESFPHQILGQPEYAPQNSVCSQSYLYVPFDTAQEAKYFIKYLKTKFFRALVSAVKITQSAPNRVYKFVPIQDFSDKSDIDWSQSIDDINRQLYKKYNLDNKEIGFIEQMIKPME